MIEQDCNASTSRSLILTISRDANRMYSKFHPLSSYWQTVPPQWRGGRLFDGSTGFSLRNGCNSVTESRKIVPKVGNERPLRGLRTGCWPKLGSYGKIGFSEILGPKKRPLLYPNHALATTGKSWSKKKSCLFPNKYQSLKKFWVFFWVKPIFG